MELQAGVGKIGFVFCGSLWRDRTAILMTHRFTTAMLADEIRVMGHCELRASLSANPTLCTLPVGPVGISARIRMRVGTLNPGRRCNAKSRRADGVVASRREPAPIAHRQVGTHRTPEDGIIDMIRSRSGRVRRARAAVFEQRVPDRAR